MDVRITDLLYQVQLREFDEHFERVRSSREIRECVKLWRRFFAELNREISEACGSPQPRTSPAIREACIHLHTWTALTKATLRNPSKVCRILLDAKIVDRCPP